MRKYKTRMCAYCKVEPADDSNHVYCRFCKLRFWKLRYAYQHAKRIPPTVAQLHRTWRHWRRTPELDTIYSEDVA